MTTSRYDIYTDTQSEVTYDSEEYVKSERPAEIVSLGVSLSLAVCYGAKIGGSAALTGSAINLVAKDYIDE